MRIGALTIVSYRPVTVFCECSNRITPPPPPFCLAHSVCVSRVFLCHIFLGGFMYLLSVLYNFGLYIEGCVPGTGYRFLSWPRAVSCATSPIALLPQVACLRG